MVDMAEGAMGEVAMDTEVEKVTEVVATVTAVEKAMEAVMVMATDLGRLTSKYRHNLSFNLSSSLTRDRTSYLKNAYIINEFLLTNKHSVRLVRLGSSPLVHPNINNLVQGEHPRILGGTGVSGVKG